MDPFLHDKEKCSQQSLQEVQLVPNAFIEGILLNVVINTVPLLQITEEARTTWRPIAVQLTKFINQTARKTNYDIKVVIGS